MVLPNINFAAMEENEKQEMGCLMNSIRKIGRGRMDIFMRPVCYCARRAVCK